MHWVLSEWSTSPLEKKWKEWHKWHNAVMFMMKHFTFEEMKALSKVLDLNTGDLQCNYGRWGPSACTFLEVGNLLCTSAGWPDLQVSACKEKQMTYFNDLDALKKTTVTVSKHSAKGGGFTVIAESLPTCIRLGDGCDWYHMSITDKEWNAQLLCGQKLSDHPDNIGIYSWVYDVGQWDIISRRLWALDEDNPKWFYCQSINEIVFLWLKGREVLGQNGKAHIFQWKNSSSSQVLQGFRWYTCQ
ncbi:hypothetical protein EI94DRAFT_1696187 [Lactarius quietus]|nr:hypothetical protein EI94DRAFT_1696187 [Lactarius quietus]